MTDSSSAPPTPGAGNGAVPSLQIAGQYIKDLSFENPSAPAGNVPGKPNIQVGMDVQARSVSADQFEAVLKVRVDAKAGDTQIYLCELAYAGLFVIKNVPQDSLQPVLLIECPRILFPFARRIIADVTRDGGFMPLLLDPIDFSILYRQQMSQMAEGPRSIT